MYSSTDQQYMWALALIYAVGSVRGITRLQKYAFLVAKEIKGIINEGFYNDWKPSHYGPFSKKLAEDICYLENRGFVTNENVSAGYDYTLGLVRITNEGKKFIENFVDHNEKFINSIEKKILPYQSKHLIDLLHDVYYLYPVFAANSKIKDKVGMGKFESDYFLNYAHNNGVN